MNGKGILIWPDGKKFQGEFKDDLREGFGRIEWPDGKIFEGLW